jgi:nitroreductase
MTKIQSEDLLQQLSWRYATKRFNPARKIPDADWQTLSRALCLAPSSYGLQPWRAIIVQNPATRKQLRAVSWDQPQIEECSHLVVLTTLKKITPEYVQRYIDRISEVRGVPTSELKQYEDMMIGDVVTGPRASIAHCWSQRQAYLAMGFLLETAALLEIDACPMEGLDPAQYDKILGLTNSEYSTVAVVALGYRTSTDSYQQYKKVRLPTEHLLEVY